MTLRSRPPFLAALAAVLALPVAALGIWSLATGTTQAGGDDDSQHVYSMIHRAVGGDGADLGVHLTEETDLDEGGARVTLVVPDSAADEAGIEVGDVIVEFDGKSVQGPMGLSDHIGDRDAGDRVDVTVLRDGRERTLDAELGERTNSAFKVMGLDSLKHLNCDDEDTNCDFNFNCEGDDCDGFEWRVASFGNKPLLGVQLVEMTRELRGHMGADSSEGVLVSRVIEDSAAEEGGIEVGDVIVAIDGDRIEDVDGIRRSLSGLAGESFDVDVIRDGRTTTIDVTLPEAEEFDHSMMRLPEGFEQDVMKTVREALSQAELSIDSKELRRALGQAEKAQHKAGKSATEAIRKSIENRNSI
jgi:predicted metalloprotease with PDZ domain